MVSRDKLTFRSNPLIIDSISRPIFWKIIFRVVLRGCEINDEPEIRNCLQNIVCGVPGVQGGHCE